MFRGHIPNLATYFLYGGIAVLMSWLMSGCRFGNSVEEAEDPDKVTGFYEAQAQSYEICSVTEDPTDPGNPTNQCNSTLPANDIPSLINEIMTNPVAVQLLNLSTGEAQVFSAYPNAVSALPLFVDMGSAGDVSIPVSLVGESAIGFPWIDNECNLLFLLDAEGSIKKTGATGAGGFPTAGRLHLGIIVSYLMNGNCDASLSYMQSCYLDTQNCFDLTDFDFIEDLLGPALQAGVVDPQNIENLSAFAYEVFYQ